MIERVRQVFPLEILEICEFWSSSKDALPSKLNVNRIKRGKNPWPATW